MTRSCPCALSIGLHCFLEQPPFSSPHWQGYGLWFRQLEFLLNQSFDTLVRSGRLLFSLPLHASSGLEMNNLQKTSFNFESFNFKFYFIFWWKFLFKNQIVVLQILKQFRSVTNINDDGRVLELDDQIKTKTCSFSPNVGFLIIGRTQLLEGALIKCAVFLFCVCWRRATNVLHRDHRQGLWHCLKVIT